MVKSVALLRGIYPSNPNMHNEKLRQAFERLGFDDVRTVLASGNVLFAARYTDRTALETRIEKALLADLGFSTSVILRSRDQLRKLVAGDPFKGFTDSPRSRLNVTFLKGPPSTRLKFPYWSADKAYGLLSLRDGAICSVVDLSGAGTPDLMRWIEKNFGRLITTRTWKTVGRILKDLDEA